ncbi:hypothetical protein OIU79_027966 [Salix purpurea]|uniref:Uncharacterized protein n=1 Tax=Salix purpurea TaxID=77065 RepID=A0A9Q0VVA4_SALPP|nr:hypothetical protein OIU79_027966 [Salix purpurea]
MAAGVEMLKKVEERGAVKEERGGVSSGGGGNGVHEFKKVMVAVRAKRRGGGEKVDAEVTFMTPACNSGCCLHLSAADLLERSVEKLSWIEDCSSFSASALEPAAAAANLDSHGFGDDETFTKS